MKRLMLCMLGLPLMFCSCGGTREEVTTDFQTYTIEQFYANISYSGGAFSPDNSKLLVSSNASGVFNLYALHVDGSAIDTLSQNTKESFFAISYFPNDERLLFTADQGGNEINHLYMVDSQGSIRDLTPGENEKASFEAWLKDQSGFLYLSNKRDPAFFDMYAMSIKDFSSRLIFENKSGMNISAVSDDLRYIALSKPITTSTNELHLFDREKQVMKQISAPGVDASFSAQAFSETSDKLYFITNEGAEFSYLATYDLDAAAVEKAFEADWDVSWMYFSPKYRYQVILLNEDASTAIQMIDTQSGEKVDFPLIPDANINAIGFSEDEKWLRITVGSSKSPSDLYVYDMATKQLKKLTNALNEEIDPSHLVSGEVIRYPSFDGLEIPSILYKPKQASADNKVPVLVWVHGGPGGQTRLGYSPLIQYLVNHGYAVIGVNNRGSSGYGKTFYRLDDKRHGEDDLMDCVYAKDYLATLDWADTSRVGIIGGSYGGYMVMAALAFQPEAFDVGVNIFGVTNWLRTLKSIPSWWEAQRKALYEELGDPYSADSIRLYQISPLFHTENVVKPLMVLQGANDPRVLQIESDEIVEGVRANGVPVEYVLFPDEGHGFRKKENEIQGYSQILTFLDTYLK